MLNGERTGATRIMTLVDVRAIAQRAGLNLTYGDMLDFTGMDGAREPVRPLPGPVATSLPQPAANLDDANDIVIVSHNNGRYGGGDFAAADHVRKTVAHAT